ncbi:hypothetical protein [Paucilactobacillus wasatchensis]|uniref:Uncharacterized protein n=1 Tax=Paucilactobacillus wasatchensis TaxID=1335616 RepID=A0A0D0Y6C3_9LACO|nr:hypothetical protein [Paucilactobacillus wasatchensis]KIS03823.1 hypothetical protein WDC_0564 [Paucilactobacillus wasatchensis]
MALVIINALVIVAMVGHFFDALKMNDPRWKLFNFVNRFAG